MSSANGKVLSMIGALEVEIPDLVGPIVALRAWRVIGDEETPILASINGVVWPPNGTGKRPFHEPEFITAYCELLHRSRLRENDEHPCPCPPNIASDHHGAGCGIYAFKNLESVAFEYPLWGMDSNAKSFNVNIWGEVELWGKVFEHVKGYRAQYARLKSLYYVRGFGLSEERVREIAEFYGAEFKEYKGDVSSLADEERLRRSIVKHVDPLFLMMAFARSVMEVAIEEISQWTRKMIYGRNWETSEDGTAGGASASAEGADP